MTNLASSRPVKIPLDIDRKVSELSNSLGVPIGTVLRFCIAEGLPIIQKNGIQPKKPIRKSA